MKTIKLILLLSSLISLPSYANAAFTYEEDAINLEEGVSIRGKKIEQLGYISLGYSQPNTIFRLDGRRNFEFAFTPSLAEQFKSYSSISTGISQDAMLLQFGGFYAGLGMGVYVKNRIDDRINTRIMIAEKAFIGYRFTTPISVELFAKNYNNSGLTDENKGQNYAGLAFSVYF